ncbi:HEAT repeat domain-containing protein [Patescibacteria group bacterium]|nr:HEAT repeat domain-containing protein [Patescibacteria group bacterium]
MKIKNLKQRLIFASSIAISIFLLFFVVTSVWIGNEVKSHCGEAKREYGGDLPVGRQGCVEALIKLLNDENKGFRERNSAIWALGQLGDSRALPVLQSYYTGNIPSRESLDKTISQHELKKAVNLTSGGFNITSYIWRNRYFEK